MWVEGKIALPVAWAIHNRTDKAFYKSFVTFYINTVGSAAESATFLRDYDGAIRETFVELRSQYPQVRSVGDIWHLLHANTMWCDTNGMKDIKQDVCDSLRLLAYVEGMHLCLHCITS